MIFNIEKCFLDIHLIEIRRYFLLFPRKKLRPDSYIFMHEEFYDQGDI